MSINQQEYREQSCLFILRRRQFPPFSSGEEGETTWVRRIWKMKQFVLMVSPSFHSRSIPIFFHINPRPSLVGFTCCGRRLKKFGRFCLRAIHSRKRMAQSLSFKIFISYLYATIYTYL